MPTEVAYDSSFIFCGANIIAPSLPLPFIDYFQRGGCGGPLRLHHSVSQAKFATYGPGARLRKRPMAGPYALLATKRARRRFGGGGEGSCGASRGLKRGRN